MKSLLWIFAGIGIGVTAYVLLNQPAQGYATGDPDIDEAAAKTSAWGTKQRFKGTGGDLAGKVKEGFGRATGDDELAGEGVLDQVAGKVKDTAGQAAHAVSDTLEDLNR